MFCDNASVYIEKLSDRFLCQPYIVILHTDFNTVLVDIPGKYKKIHSAVSDLQLCIPVLSHYVSPSNHSSSELFSSPCSYKHYASSCTEGCKTQRLVCLKALVQCLQSLIGFSLSVSIKLNIICTPGRRE